MNPRLAIALLVLAWALVQPHLQAQETKAEAYNRYITTYKDLAISEMKLYKIPASIILAQGIIESNCGKSGLTLATNNHFGIKCHKDWKGETYLYDDDAAQECFRKYPSVADSYRDHSLFLSTRARYAPLFSLAITDYRGWADGLKSCGYATNPDYPLILERVIEENELYRFDDTTATGQLADDREPEHHPKPIDFAPGFHPAGRIVFLERYIQPKPSFFEFAYTAESGRVVYENYGVALILARDGDTWQSLAKEFKLFARQLPRQNDLLHSDKPVPGQIVYLEPKKRKQPRTGEYLSKKGDSMYSICQEYCIRKSRLLKYNHIHEGEEPNPGTPIRFKPGK